MSQQLEAVFEHGVLRPLQPLSLPEHQAVRLTLDITPRPKEPSQDRTTAVNDRPRVWRSVVSVDEHTEDLCWLANQSAPYAGEWVALQGGRLVAHGLRLADVRIAASAAGAADALFSSVPDHPEIPFGGW